MVVVYNIYIFIYTYYYYIYYIYTHTFYIYIYLYQLNISYVVYIFFSLVVGEKLLVSFDKTSTSLLFHVPFRDPCSHAVSSRPRNTSVCFDFSAWLQFFLSLFAISILLSFYDFSFLSLSPRYICILSSRFSFLLSITRFSTN